MKNFYLIDYLKDNYSIDKELLDALKFQLDGHLFYFGHQFKGHFEDVKNESRIVWIKEKFKDILRITRGFFKSYPKNDKPKILSNAYFTYDEELSRLGFNVFLSPWMRQFVRGYPPRRIKRRFHYIESFFKSKGFNDLIGQQFLSNIRETEEILEKFYSENDYRAVCVPYDMPFFENWHIKIFRKLNRPSFILLHGLTQGYENINDNRSDYLVVWGEKIKENYVKAGVKSDKIFISGHPYYKKFERVDLKFGFDDILVLGYPAISVHNTNGVMLQNRGTSILYLYSIQKMLKEFGVGGVRFRPHPSENPEWYLKFIDRNFYKLDLRPLKESLGSSSLIIGNSSTTILEAIYHGVNYVVYEPSVNNFAWGSKYQLINPYDGSDPRVPAAKNEDDLRYILRHKEKINPEVFNDYIKTPFDISFMKKLILEH